MTQVGRDEYEAFDRPRRRSSRPRTKDRPDYADAETGMVITVEPAIIRNHGIYQVEQNVAVTETGREMLTRTSHELRTI